MANEKTAKNKWIDAVGKLLNLTQERKLIWRAGYEVDYQNNPVEVYETEYAGKTLRLTAFPRLYLVEPGTGTRWEFPSMEATSYLLEAVKYQVVGVGGFLDDLLAAAL